jgi:hypothetical protein
MRIPRTTNTLTQANQRIAQLALLHTNPTLLPIIPNSLTLLSIPIINPKLNFINIFVHVDGLTLFVDDLFYAEFYFTHFENVTLF